MPNSNLQPVWPDMNPEEMSPEQMALAALRHEIDLVDDELLALVQRRLAIAAKVGLAKDAPHGPHTKLRPDREQTVLSRVMAKADPENAVAVEGLWREIVGWGLARQGQLQVQVWAPTDPTRAFDGARHRFGAAAAIRMVRDPQGALAFAAEVYGLTVLRNDLQDSEDNRTRFVLLAREPG